MEFYFVAVLGGGVRELAHPEIVDDEEWHGGHVREIGLARPVERDVGELLQQRVRLAIQHTIPDQIAGMKELAKTRPWPEPTKPSLHSGPPTAGRSCSTSVADR